MNANTILLTIGFSLSGWGAHEAYMEMRHVHDEVLVIKTEMVPRREFDLQITELKARLSSIEIQVDMMKKQSR